MGVPSFYKWLVESFPLSVVDAVFDPSPAPDLTGPNPNGMEFDNLYLDMNGIIHPCFHPEGLPAPKTYDEVFKSVFKYMDKVFSVVRPRKLLYLAIDGVAPRAKMNQQRSRRFRAAKDAAEEMSFMAPQKEEIGGSVSESQEKSTCLEQSSKLDSNVITPGTEFMALLSSALHYYIHLRMNEEPAWQGIKVILSDASVPGEGEHKIMSYIRSQRTLNGFDPNTRHCLYGLDADLIMLALATHEIHFSILREDVQKPRSFPKSGRDSSQIFPLQVEVVGETMEDYISKLQFQFLHVWILREYLSYAMEIPNQKDGDVERLIDDFVLICLFAGNDFLPHVPSLEISEGAIDLLMTIYKEEFVRMGGYLTKSFKVDLKKMKYFLKAVGSHEGAILRKRAQSRALEVRAPKGSVSLSTNTKVDKIKYGEVGWKERYYAEKFEAETKDDCERIRQDVVFKYTEGICWVMRYYYEGVCSWQWFYPYHYAPFSSDFHDIGKLKIQFTLGQPFKPFDQLMAVLPSASAHALPLFYRKLMTETSSPLFAFYPTDFELDMNGKRFSWQAICKLPFIKESLLLSAIARVEHTLTDEERQRNRLGLDVLFVHSSHSLSESIVLFSQRNELVALVKQKINPKFSGGMNGYMFIPDKPVKPEQIDSPVDGMEMIANNKVLSVFYGNPRFPGHIPRPLEQVAWPSKCICKKDIKPKPFLWHEQTAVVGRLHSQMPIPNSISGSHLAKSARQLVLIWCHEMQQKSTGSLERGEGASADGVLCCENSRTVCLGDVGANGPASTVEVASVGGIAGDKSCSNGSDGKSSARKSRKRKRKSKQSNDCELMASDSILQGTSSAHVTGDDKNYSNGRSDEQSVGDTAGDKSCCNGGYGKSSARKSRKRKRKSKQNSNCELMASRSNLQGTSFAHVTVDELTHQLQDQTAGDKSSTNGGSRKRKKKLRRNKANKLIPNEDEDTIGLSSPYNLRKGICSDEGQGEKTMVAELSKYAVGVQDKNQGREESACELLVDQTVDNKSIILEGTDGLSGHVDLDKGIFAKGAHCEKTIAAVVTRKQAVGVPDQNAGGESSIATSIDGGLRKRKREQRHKRGNDIPNERVGLDGLACCSNSGETVSASGHEGDKNNVGGKSLEPKQEQKKRNVIPDNIVGGIESTFSNLKEAVYATPTETNGNWMDGHVSED